MQMFGTHLCVCVLLCRNSRSTKANTVAPSTGRRSKHSSTRSRQGSHSLDITSQAWILSGPKEYSVLQFAPLGQEIN